MDASKLPTGWIQLKLGPDYVATYNLFGIWEPVGAGDSCTYRLSSGSVAIPGLTQLSVCELVAEEETEEVCITRGWTVDMADIPASPTTVPVEMKQALHVTTIRTFHRRYFFRYSHSSMRVEVYLARKKLDCGEGEKCQWVVSVRLVGDGTRAARIVSDSPIASTEIFRVPDPFIHSCRAVLDPGAEYQLSDDSSSNACSRALFGTDPVSYVTRSTKMTSRPELVEFLPGSSSGCIDPNLPIDDDQEEFIVPTGICSGASICAPASSPPPPPTWMARKTFLPATSRWEWFASTMAVWTTPNDTVAGCYVGGQMRHLGSKDATPFNSGKPILLETSYGESFDAVCTTHHPSVSVDRPAFSLQFHW